MIKKSIIVAIILLGIHALIAMMDPLPSGQYSFQQNIVKAQSFMYGETEKNIVVGSSLSEKLAMDSLPGFYNLSFVGLSVFDGLHIILSNKKYPRNILIETNLILRPENESFLSVVESPVLSPVKKVIPSLRDRYQPFGVFGETVISFFKSKRSTTSVEPVAPPTGVNEVDNVAFGKMLNILIKENNEPPAEAELTYRFGSLKTMVDDLTEHGVNVVFFEMPVNESVCDLVQPKMLREYFYKYFPPSAYHYINRPDCKGYTTTDGAHLTDDEAVRFTNYLRTQSQPLLVAQN